MSRRDCLAGFAELMPKRGAQSKKDAKEFADKPSISVDQEDIDVEVSSYGEPTSTIVR